MKVSIFFVLALGCFGGERATVTGKVTDADGKPVEHATVLVFEAGVKKGYSVYCPTCWIDCGKLTTTDAEGNYKIPDLSPDLIFKLLAIHDGFSATYVDKVNPDNGPAATAVLKPRIEVADVSRIVRGRVVDTQGDPVRNALVEQQGVTYRNARGTESTMFGNDDRWTDLIAVTNSNGEFEMAYGSPAVRMILQVRPRGMAAKLFTEPTGADRKTMVVTDGATIRGRLVHNGKPVADAQLGLTTHRRMAGAVYDEMRIGTNADGKFSMTNVPPGRIWLLYPKMEPLASRGIGSDVIPCETKDDGQIIDVGDIELIPTYTVRGRVQLKDGRPIPPDMHVSLNDDRTLDSQMATLGQDGSFEFKGVSKGIYDLAPGIRGYKLAEGFSFEVMVNRDRNDVVIQMEPGKR